jgi:hypothetical protein
MKFSSNLVVRKIQYQDKLVKEGLYTYTEVVELSMRKLREEIDELEVKTITEVSMTRAGHTSYITRQAS